MEDQQMALEKIGINATVVSSAIPPKDVTAIQNMLIEKQCPYKLVYVTPERIAKSKRFLAKLEKAYTSIYIIFQTFLYITVEDTYLKREGELE